MGAMSMIEMSSFYAGSYRKRLEAKMPLTKLADAS